MIFNFHQYSLNEASDAAISKVHDLFEEDLVKQDFIKKWFDKTEFGYGDDYELDSDKDGAGDTIVWIEILNPSKEAVDALDTNYNEFVKPFEEWAKQHDIYDPQITTTENSFSFTVTL